jgi:4-diphosphocytidyl-2-C-methyl-D-erythritol kinase
MGGGPKAVIMHLYRSPSGWVVQAPAKLNLFFELVAKRDDGYHEVETLVYPIGLYDTVHFVDETHDRITFRCRTASGVWGREGAGLGRVPSGDDNLAVRALQLLKRQARVRGGGQLRLAKRIPSAAGLGGGSSDAAAALLAAHAAWSLNWSLDELGRLGAQIGSDVPAFLVGGPVVCRGRGEQVEPILGAPSLHFVVVRPPAGLSTAEVYRASRLPRRPRRVAELARALARGDTAGVGHLLFNRLETTAKHLSPWIGRVERAMARLDLLGHGMTGSGSCYFGLCHHARHARRLANRLRAAGIGNAFAVQGSR